MGETTLIDLSRMMVLQRKLDVAANNVANIDTTAYRSQQLSFREHLTPIKRQETGIARERPLSLVDAATAFLTSTNGGLRITGNPLDVAIDGNAYFAVQTPEGLRYTRAGSFALDGAGRLVTMTGEPVLSDRGAISIPLQAGAIIIDAQGVVSTKQGILGRLRLVGFPPGADLQPTGENMFRSDRGAVDASNGSVKLIQGALEHSNVEPTFEMSRVAEITRSYEIASKLLKGSQDVTDLNKMAQVPD